LPFSFFIHSLLFTFLSFDLIIALFAVALIRLRLFQLSVMASVGAFGAVAQAESVAKDVEQQQTHSRDDSSIDSDHTVERQSTSEADRDEKVKQLARTFTQRSVRHGDGGDYVNPFLGSDDPLLDPASGKFSARAWVKTLIGIQSRDPERYPRRVAGVSYKNLNVHGFGTPTDYQKSFGNAPLELFSLFDKLRGRGQTKIQILRDFDGLIKSGEMLVVLGRPGR
jgi:ATP-binding cassette subfamily G (WHITE) protein 2 (PDR)